MGPEICQTLTTGHRRLLTAGDWYRIERTFDRVRGPSLGGWRDLHPEWYTTSFAMHELASARTLRYGPFLRIAPSRRLDDFVTCLDSGVEVPGREFSTRYRLLRKNFRWSQMRGVPVLGADRICGPYVVLEGLSRCSVLLSRSLRERDVPRRIDALLGVTRRAKSWPLF